MKIFKYISVSAVIVGLILNPLVAMAAPTLVTTVSAGPDPDVITALGNNVYVGSYVGKSISIIDGTTNAVTGPVGIGINALYMATVGSKVYTIGSGSTQISVLNTANNNSTSSIAVGAGGVYFFAVLGTKLYAPRYGTGMVDIIDTVTDTVIASVAAGTNPYALTVLGNRVYVGNYNSGNVTIIDGTSNTVVGTVTVGTNPGELIGSGNKVYVVVGNQAQVTVINTANSNSTSSISIPTTPLAYGYNLEVLGSKVYMSNYGGVTVIDNVDDSVSNVNLGMTNNNYPSDIHALGTKIYATNPQSGTVGIIDTANNNSTSSIAVGSNPFAFASVGTKLYVLRQSSVAIIETAEPLTDTGGGGGCSTQYVVEGTDMYTITCGTKTFHSHIIQLPLPGINTVAASTSLATTTSVTATTTASTTAPMLATSTDTTTLPVKPVFTRDLSLRSVGSDVKALQKLLNFLGFTVSSQGAGSSGNETTYFGTATRAALIRLQKSASIFPSAGYFGRITRGYMNGLQEK